MKQIKLVRKILAAALIIVSICTMIVPSFAETQEGTPWKIDNSLYEYFDDFYADHKKNTSTEYFYEVFASYDKEYVEQRMQEITKELNIDGKSEREKVEAIVLWIYTHAQYGYKAVFGADLKKPRLDSVVSHPAFDTVGGWISSCQSFIGVDAAKLAVCVGLAKTFFYLAASSGLETCQTGGVMSKTGHEWNLVKVDEKWYAVDLSKPNSNSFMVDPINQGKYRSTDYSHYYPETGMVKRYSNPCPYFPTTAEPFSISYDMSQPEIHATTISVEPGCGASMKISFSKVENAICYIVNRCYYIDDYLTRTTPPTGNRLAVISAEEAERLNYTYYDNSYFYDSGEEWEPKAWMSDETSSKLWEGKKYIYSVTTYGPQMKFGKVYLSNFAVATTNSDRGKLSLNIWDGKLEPHHFNEPVVIQPATCNHTGVKKIVCKDCGYTCFGDIPRNANGHVYASKTTKQPTCTEAGIKTLTCTVCGDTKNEAIAAKGHSFGKQQVIEFNDCENDGYAIQICSTCKKEEKVILKATGHNWSDYVVVSAPTCTVIGTERTTCKNCGSYKERNIATLPHKYESQGYIEEPTCEYTGKELLKCKDCGTSVQQTVPALGHNYIHETVEASPYTLGYTVHTCSLCGNTYTSNYINPTGEFKVAKVYKRTQAAQAITWSKVPTASGYQIQRTTGKKFDGRTNVNLRNVNQNTYVYKGLNSMTRYKFRVRYYIIGEDGKYHFGPWKVISSPTLPKVNSVSKITSSKKALTVKWKKQAGVTGYQVQYATKGTFSNAKKVTVFGAVNLSKKITGLRSGQKYFVRVRTFKKIAGVYYFSIWSNVKSAKTK